MPVNISALCGTGPLMIELSETKLFAQCTDDVIEGPPRGLGEKRNRIIYLKGARDVPGINLRWLKTVYST